MQGGVLLLAEGFARLIENGACRVARVSLSGKESGGKSWLLGDRPTGVLHWYARIGAGREWH